MLWNETVRFIRLRCRTVGSEGYETPTAHFKKLQCGRVGLEGLWAICGNE
jgi:hypothetical protein